jgi:hypothetical protein
MRATAAADGKNPHSPLGQPVPHCGEFFTCNNNLSVFEVGDAIPDRITASRKLFQKILTSFVFLFNYAFSKNS